MTTRLRPLLQRRTRSLPVAGSGGFTQVELLVSIGIIAILLSLYLPMIARTRDSARGVQCKDNLHNLILAANNYQSNFLTFPAGAIGSRRPILNVPGGDGVSWCALILDYIEQRPLSQAIDFSQPLDSRDLELLRQSHLEVYTCPSSTVGEMDDSPGSNYAGCHHQLEAPIDVDNHGALVLNRGLRVTEFPDGFSQTLFIGEKEIAPGDLGWWSGSRATLRNAGHPLMRVQAEAAASVPAPPANPPEVGGFASGHVWGVHFALGDSSVRLLSFDTDPLVLQRLADRADGELSVDPTSQSRTELDHGRRASTSTTR